MAQGEQLSQLAKLILVNRNERNKDRYPRPDEVTPTKKDFTAHPIGDGQYAFVSEWGLEGQPIKLTQIEVDRKDDSFEDEDLRFKHLFETTKDGFLAGGKTIGQINPNERRILNGIMKQWLVIRNEDGSYKDAKAEGAPRQESVNLALKRAIDLYSGKLTSSEQNQRRKDLNFIEDYLSLIAPGEKTWKSGYLYTDAEKFPNTPNIVEGEVYSKHPKYRLPPRQIIIGVLDRLARVGSDYYGTGSMPGVPLPVDEALKNQIWGLKGEVIEAIEEDLETNEDAQILQGGFIDGSTRSRQAIQREREQHEAAKEYLNQ